jgi:hypothetical protein
MLVPYYEKTLYSRENNKLVVCGLKASNKKTGVWVGAISRLLLSALAFPQQEQKCRANG